MRAWLSPRGWFSIVPIFAAFCLVLGAPARALAWVEVHVLGDDATVRLDTQGKAEIEHRVTFRVGGGPLDSLDIPGVDGDAVPGNDAYVVNERDGRLGTLRGAIPVSATVIAPKKSGAGNPVEPTTLRVSFAPEGLTRGTYVLVLRYTTDLAARGLVKREGSLVRVAWNGPIWPDGYESARTLFAFAVSPTPPRVDDSDGAARLPGAPPSETVLSTVRRTAEHDEIELVRPYAPLGESLRWAVWADARALAALPAPAPPEPPKPTVLPAKKGLSDPQQRGLLFGGGALLFALYAALVSIKSRQVERHGKARAAKPRPLVPLHPSLRALFGGVALVAGVALQVTQSNVLPGALLVLVSAGFAAFLTPRWARVARGPGRWLSIHEAEAFRKPPRPQGAFLDVSTRAGKVLFVLAMLGFGAATWALKPFGTRPMAIVVMDFIVLLALFGTGRLRELPPDPVVDAVEPLSALAKRLTRLAKRTGPLKISPRIRVPERCPDADELRLLVLPERALTGLIGIEVGIVFFQGAGGPIGLPEILLRVTRGSPAEAASTRIARAGRSARGRKPDELVIALAPRLPTTRMTAELVAALAARFVDRERKPTAVRRAA